MKKLFLLLAVMGLLFVSCEEYGFQDPTNNNPIEQPEDIFELTDDDSYTVDAEGGTVQIVVTTNIEYTVDIPKKAQEWLSVSDTRATRTEKLTFTIEENDSDKKRSTTVRLLDIDGNKLQTIKFKQEAAADKDDDNEGESNEDDGTGNEDSDNGDKDDDNGDNGNEGNEGNEEGDTGDDTQPTSGLLTLSVDKTAVALGDVVTFTVTQAGVDVTAESIIYDKNMEKVEGGKFEANVAGSYSFFATKGGESSNYVNVSVVASIPELPEDTDAANTKFNHRILLVDHTGVNCGYCPMMIDNLRAFETKYPNWVEHVSEVTCHAGSMAGGDPGGSAAANIVNSFFRPNGYPNLSLNFYDGEIGNYQESYFCQLMNQEFTKLVKLDGADAGIAIATTGDPTVAFASVAVKAAVEQEYKITAWLLESKIYSKNQAGATKDYHFIYDHALRNIAGDYTSSDLSGMSLGVIKAGQTVDTAFELPITSKAWNYENMEVLVIVSAKNETKKWEVVNTAVCPINSNIGFEYLQ